MPNSIEEGRQIQSFETDAQNQRRKKNHVTCVQNLQGTRELLSMIMWLVNEESLLVEAHQRWMDEMNGKARSLRKIVDIIYGLR